MSKYNLIDIYEQYQIGSGWTKDFDYDGMLKAGLSVNVDMDIETMKKIVEDFTDVNYHREASHLYDAIEALEAGDVAEANGRISDFHIEIKRTMKDQGMDMSDDLGAYMASKMEENKEAVDLAIEASQEKAGIKEVTSREGSRIEGLLDRGLKSKFLEAFSDLYFDLVEEDPFMAEDVVDHLGIEMLKHLDAIQAQGDKLAGLEEDAIEDEPVTEDMFGPVKFLKSKGIDDDVIKDFMKVHAKDIVGASEDEIMDEFENFRSVNYDYVDENLKEHFGRFMKDYQ